MYEQLANHISVKISLDILQYGGHITAGQYQASCISCTGVTGKWKLEYSYVAGPPQKVSRSPMKTQSLHVIVTCYIKFKAQSSRLNARDPRSMAQEQPTVRPIIVSITQIYVACIKVDQNLQITVR